VRGTLAGWHKAGPARGRPLPQDVDRVRACLYYRSRIHYVQM